MWTRFRINSNDYSVNRANVRLRLETLDFRDVPSSILDPSSGDPTLTSLSPTDSLDQSTLVSSQDTSSDSNTTNSDSTQTDTSANGTTSEGTTSTTNGATTDSTGSTIGLSTADTSSTASTDLASLPATTSTESSSATKAAGAAPATTSTSTTTTTSGTGLPIASPPTGIAAGNGINHGFQPDTSGPEIINFMGVEVSGTMWDFTGTVLDSQPAGLTVNFGGEPESLQGKSTITDANGNFGYAIQLNANGTDNGVATAVTTDGQGLESNTATCAVNLG